MISDWLLWVKLMRLADPENPIDFSSELPATAADDLPFITSRKFSVFIALLIVLSPSQRSKFHSALPNRMLGRMGSRTSELTATLSAVISALAPTVALALNL